MKYMLVLVLVAACAQSIRVPADPNRIFDCVYSGSELLGQVVGFDGRPSDPSYRVMPAPPDSIFSLAPTDNLRYRDCPEWFPARSM